jgi:hypothetical protein
MDLPTVAYDSPTGTINYTIGVEMKTDGGKTRLALRFPYHTSMFYDPVTSFVEVTDAETSGGNIAVASGVDATASGSSSNSSTSGTTTAKNGASGAPAVRGLLLGGLGAAMLFMLGF